ncbi:MAG: LamG domain-containing protein, partial [Thermoguttaceae bacterium]|nr:LamG domain-containing protein [Thermoguttaceae bacterium]
MRVAEFFFAIAAIAVLAGNRAHADPVVPNLVAYWDFNQTAGTGLPSVVGDYGGALAGSWPGDNSQWVQSTLGLGQVLNFKGGWVDMGGLPKANPMNVSGNLTIAAWIKPDTLGGSSAGRIFNHRTDTTGHGGYELYLRSGGALAVHGVNGTGSYVYTPAGAITVGSTAPWQHVAVTMSEVVADKTTLTFYVDGRQVHTASVTPPPVITAADPTLLLGYSTTHSPRGFDGLMDDMGVWGQALAPAHIATLHSVVHHKALNYDLGQAQQLFELHGAGAGSATIGGRTWNYATGLSTNPADLGKVVVADGKYTIALDATGAGVSAQSKLAAYWNFNQSSGTTLPDVLGNYHGTLAGSWPGDGSGWVAGKDGLGNALNFSSGWVDMGAVPQDNPMNASGALTIAAWIKPDSLGGNNAGRIFNHRSDSQSSGYEVYLRGTGQLALHYGPSLYTSSAVGAVEVGPDAPWQHVAVTLSEVYQVQVGEDWVDRTRLTFYVNGEAKSSHVISPPVPVPTDPTLLLGDSTTHGSPAPGERGFDGLMDEVAVWSTPLASPHVRALFSLADHADIRHDLGQVQALFDTYDAGLGGSVRHGSLQWESVTGLRTDVAAVGEVFKSDGRYMVALDSSGTGFAANAELIGHWQFDETSGKTAYDSAGTNDGTLHGIDDNLPTRIEGKFGSALAFDSQLAQQVDVGAGNVVTALDGAKTFSFWTRLKDNKPSSNSFLGIDNDTSGNRWYIDDHNSGGDLRVSQDGGGPSEELFIVDNVLNYNSPQWQHVLLADDGTGPGGARVYVDGQLVATVKSFDYSGLLPGSVLRFGVARHIDGYRWLKGDLDDVGVWRVALTDPQAKALYNVAQHAELGYDLGQVQKLFNAHNDGGGTRVDGRYWVHAIGLNADVEALGQVVQDGQRFYLPLAGDGTGVWAPGKLIAHWTFDDGAGTRVTDAMGNVHGTLQGSDGTGAWIAGGRVGGALRLDSSQSQYVLAGSDNVVTNMPGEKTIAFWVRMEETGGSGRSNGFISIDRDGNDRWYLDTGTGTDTTDIRAFRADGGGGADLFRVSGVLEYDEWQHVVVTDDGTGSGGVKVFVNGEL